MIMYSRMLHVFLSVLCLTALTLSSTTVSAGESILIQADEWCPHNCDPDGDMQGYMIDIARAIFEKQGIEVRYELNGWDESLEAASNGDCDAVVGAAPSEAPDLVFPTEPQGSSVMVFMARADSDLVYTGPESLGSAVVGVIAEYAYDEGPFDEYVAANADDPSKVIVESSDNALELNIQRLLDGTVQVIVDDAAVIDYKLFTMNLGGMLKPIGRDAEDGIFMAISPKHPRAQEFAAMLDEGMQELRANGELATILGSYGLTDWQ